VNVYTRGVGIMKNEFSLLSAMDRKMSKFKFQKGPVKVLE
jgi:hypothetical protein